MGRSRRRQQRVTPAAPGARARRAPAPTAAPERLRRTLFAYLAGAVALAVVFLLGTLTLGGTLAPWLVLVVVAAGGAALYRWAQGRLGGLALGDEERILQTLAAGLVLLVTAFAAIAAIALTV
jgi:hypothetical protein